MKKLQDYQDLKGADLRGADLRNADLRNADLRNADLGNADLIGANLGGVNLRGADLRNADLGGVNLIDADLRNANLEGAYFYYSFVAYDTSKRIVHCVKHKNTWMIKAGCFWGTLDELEEKVLSSHKSDVYLANIKILKKI